MRVGILDTVCLDIVAVIAQISVEHGLEFYTHHVAPFRTVGKIEQIAFRGALHLRTGHPLRIVFRLRSLFRGGKRRHRRASEGR